MYRAAWITSAVGLLQKHAAQVVREPRKWEHVQSLVYRAFCCYVSFSLTRYDLCKAFPNMFSSMPCFQGNLLYCIQSCKCKNVHFFFFRWRNWGTAWVSKFRELGSSGTGNQCGDVTWSTSWTLLPFYLKYNTRFVHLSIQSVITYWRVVHLERGREVTKRMGEEKVSQVQHRQRAGRWGLPWGSLVKTVTLPLLMYLQMYS